VIQIKTGKIQGDSNKTGKIQGDSNKNWKNTR